jgi:hypothetical protein
MKLTSHKTESVYRRYAITSEADLSEGLQKLATLHIHESREPRTVTVLAQSRGETLMDRNRDRMGKCLKVVAEAGVEPARDLWTRGILSPPSE